MEENKNLNFITRFTSSIAKFDNYRIFAKESAGKAILFLLIFTLIFSTIKLSRFIYDFNWGLTEGTKFITEKMPDFQFKNGELSIDEEMPIVINENADIFIIDTSGTTDESILNNYDTGVLITKDMFIQKENSITTRTINFSDLKTINFNKNKLISLMPILKWGNAFIIFFGLLFYFIGKLINALLLSIVAIIISKSKNLKIPYGGLYGISIYSLILPSLIGVVSSLASINIPRWTLISSAISIFYIWKAVSVIKEYNNHNDDMQPFKLQ